MGIAHADDAEILREYVPPEMLARLEVCALYVRRAAPNGEPMRGLDLSLIQNHFVYIGEDLSVSMTVARIVENSLFSAGFWK